ALGCVLWLDAGLRDADQADVLVASGVETIVAGLERLAGPRALSRLCARHAARVIFSLDLTQGRPLGSLYGWDSGTAWEVAVGACAGRTICGGFRTLASAWCWWRPPCTTADWPVQTWCRSRRREPLAFLLSRPCHESYHAEKHRTGLFVGTAGSAVPWPDRRA